MSIVLRFTVLAVAVASIVWLVRDTGVPFEKLLSTDWRFVGLVVVCQLASNALLAESLRLNIGRHKLTFVDAHRITYIRVYANLVFPLAGTGYVAYLMKNRFGISVTRLGAASIEWTAHQYFAVALLGLLASTLVATGQRTVLALIFACILLAGTTWLIAARFMPLQWTGRFHDALAEWRAEQLGAVTLVHSMALQFLLTLLRAFRLGFALLAVGFWPGAAETLFYSLAGDMVTLVNITPHGIGLREALITLSAEVLNAGAGIVLLAALLDRVVVSVISIILGARCMKTVGPAVEENRK